MAHSVVSDMTSPPTQQNTHHRYQSKMYEDFQSAASPTDTENAFRGHTQSPSIGASTLTPSAPSERAHDRLKHFSDGSQVAYAEITSPEPQFVDISKYRNSDKEAYRHSTLSGNTAQDGTLAPIRVDDDGKERTEDESERKTRIAGLKRRTFWGILIGLGVIIVLALALGLGLGLGLKKKSDASSANETAASQTMIGGTINPKYYSKQGAFNGTGIAIASTSSGVDPDIFVFYQLYNGNIQQLLRKADGTWLPVAAVATNARNATPITAVAYTDSNYIATMHVFYIDEDNVVRQKTSSNQTQGQENIWMEGPLNQLNLSTLDSELVGLQACYWGNYYGSASNVNRANQPTRSKPTTGMNLFYASDNSTFVQYDWTNGQTAWNRSNTFNNMNTRAGVGCQTWLSGATQYLFMADTTNTIRIMWRDTDTNKTSTADHPINVWTNTSVSIADVHPSTSIGYTDFLAYQDPQSLFHGVNITWAAENTKIATVPSTNGGTPQNDQWVIDTDVRGIPSSHMAITALDTASGGRQLALLYQSIASSDQGDGITIGWRDSSSQGGWSEAFVPVAGTSS